MLILLISGLLTVNQFGLHNNTVCGRKPWHLVISSNNKYCFEQYLLYLFSHPQEFFLLCIPKKQQPHKHWVEVTTLLWLCLHSLIMLLLLFLTLSSWCNFHKWSRLLPWMWAQSQTKICTGMAQTQIYEGIHESYRFNHLYFCCKTEHSFILFKWQRRILSHEMMGKNSSVDWWSMKQNWCMHL